jgi:diguanylate cyclase (GGDEF)-like protein
LLVVDDEPYILATLNAILNADYEVVSAESAEAAQEIFRRRPIDILLTDQKMPHLSGVQLLEWVRLNYPRTVRLLMTGYSELEEAVAAINRGQVFHYLFKPWRTEELLQTLHSAAHTFRLQRDNAQLLEELLRLNQELEQRVKQRTRELEEANAELEKKNHLLEKLALTDPLTGLANLRAIKELAEKELRRRERHPSPLALGVIDIDHFKDINSRYLLSGGDQVLIDLAKVLTNTLRTSSVDILGRIGGEEFLVIAPQTDMEGARALGERMRATVEETRFCYNDEPIRVTISIGFAVSGAGEQVDYQHLKHVADQALNQAKRTGRNRCVFAPAVLSPMEQAG